MKAIRLTKVYCPLDDTSAAFVTFQMKGGTTTDILISIPEYRKLGALLMNEGFKLEYKKDSEGYLRQETIELT